MSQEGYDKLVADLHHLEAIERPKASAAIAEAADKGDLSENSEYDAAKEAQVHLEEKINNLKMTLAQAKIVYLVAHCTRLAHLVGGRRCGDQDPQRCHQVAHRQD